MDLQSSLVANGYETDMGARLFRGRRHVDDEMIPCVAIHEGDDTVRDGPTRSGDVSLAQEYTIFGYLACDPDQPNTAAHALLRDMKRAVFRTAGVADARWGGAVRKVTYVGRSIGPRADGAAFVLAAIRIQVEYVESLVQP